MDANQDLYLKLKDGYRMEKPDTATQEVTRALKLFNIKLTANFTSYSDLRHNVKLLVCQSRVEAIVQCFSGKAKKTFGKWSG